MLQNRGERERADHHYGNRFARCNTARGVGNTRRLMSAGNTSVSAAGRRRFQNFRKLGRGCENAAARAHCYFRRKCDILYAIARGLCPSERDGTDRTDADKRM